MLDICVWFGFMVAGVIGFAYIRMNSRTWGPARQTRMTILIFGAQIALMMLWILYGMHAADQHLKESQFRAAEAYRDNWKHAQQLPLGYPLTTQALNELKFGLDHDPRGVAAALGEDELARLKERMAKNDEALAEKDALASKINDQKKQIAAMREETDKRMADARQITAITDRYADPMRKAQAAVKEHRRIAPPGDYTLTVDYTMKKNGALDQIELAMLLSLVQMECLSEPNLNTTGEHYTRHFDGVSQEYAELMGARLKAAGASVTVAKSAAEK